MKLTKKRNDGFTVFELMVSIIAFSIMVAAVGSILVATWQGWANNRRSILMQRDATITMHLIAREIRRTPLLTGGFSITVGDPLTCVNTNGTYIFTRSGGDLQMSANGTIITLAENCTGFDSSITNGGVRVDLDLDIGSDSSQNTIMVYSRN